MHQNDISGMVHTYKVRSPLWYRVGDGVPLWVFIVILDIPKRMDSSWLNLEHWILFTFCWYWCHLTLPYVHHIGSSLFSIFYWWKINQNDTRNKQVLINSAILLWGVAIKYPYSVVHLRVNCHLTNPYINGKY